MQEFSESSGRDYEIFGVKSSEPHQLHRQILHWAHVQPHLPAFVYLADGEREASRLTYGQLEARVAGMAGWLREHRMQGERVLLLYPYGLDFVCALFGCMRAGAIAVPAHAPGSQGLVRAVPRLQAIVRHAEPALVLSSDSVIKSTGELMERYPELGGWPLVSTDSIGPARDADRVEAGLDPHTQALLQYTSGSTSAPKAVSISHENLLHNMRLISAAAAGTEVRTFVSWLPPYHDMGLIAAIMWPSYRGITSVLMPPTSFVRSPLRWLKAIERSRAPVTAAPNFGYELCMRRLKRQDIDALDLSDWRVAFNGAEPVRADSMERFCRTFEPSGFKAGTFRPCYGMAEATLAITAKAHTASYLVQDFDAAALERGRVVPGQGRRGRQLVGCGRVLGDDDAVRIVNPETMAPSAPHHVGEIWLAGRSVARGYWGAHEEDQRCFGAQLPGDARKYLRTGDMGFFWKGELFVCGRLKDLIVVRGVNHHPEDIERTVQSVSDALVASGGAAFSVDIDDEEKVVVVQEVDTRLGPDPTCLSNDVRQRVGLEHELVIHDLVFIKRGSLAKTSSGKVRRRTARQQYLQGELVVVKPCTAGLVPKNGTDPKLRQTCAIIAASLGVALSEVGERTSLASLGLDSLRVIELQSAIERAFGVHLKLRDVYQSRDPAALWASIQQGPRGHDSMSMAVTDSSHKLDAPFDLTPLQQAYWIGGRPGVPGGGVRCHVYLEYDFSHLDLSRLSSVIQALSKRHPSLRTVVGDDGLQRVLPQSQGQPPVLVRDLSRLSPSDADVRLGGIREQLSHRMRDVSCEPALFLMANILADRTRLHISMDLLSADILSLRTLVREAVHSYQGGGELPTIDMTFRQFVEARELYRQTDAYHRDRNYWSKRAPVIASPPELPQAASLEDCGRPRFRRLHARLDTHRWKELQERARELGVTPTGLLCAIYFEVLRRWSANEEMSIVLTFSNRPQIHPHIDRVVGHFSSSIVFSPPAGAASFTERVRALQAQLWDDLEHASYDGVDVLRELHRSNGHPTACRPSVVFTSALSQNEHDESQFDPAWFHFVYGISQTPQVTLDHHVLEVGGELYFNWDFVEEVYPRGLVEAMFAAYGDALERLACVPTAAQQTDIVELPAEQLQIRARVNQTSVPLSSGVAFSGFERQARSRPEQLALVNGSVRLTYSEVYERARGLASRLCAYGVRKEMLVPIVLPKSWQQIVAVLGVQLAGGAYVPLDPAQPLARLRRMLRDCQAHHVIASHDAQELDCVMVHHVEDCIEPPQAALPTVEPGDLAYVTYTSGSTGQPKGVMIEHRSVVNRITDMNRRFGIGREDRVLALTALNHDMSVYDIFGILAAGGAIVIPGSTEIRDPAAWVRLAEEHCVSVWNSVPAFFSMLLEYLAPGQPLPSSLQHVWLSGDWIPVADAARTRRDNPGVNLVSFGGATETTIWDIHFPVREVDEGWSSVPYGIPLANAAYHVLDERGRPCPDWVAGELYAEGIGLARGFWNDAEKTRERFTALPGSGRRVYRFGDMGRYRPDGNIELLGRADDQLKVRGYRVEPAEIESALTRHAEVRAAAVVAVGERSRQRLAAYMVSRSQRAVDDAELVAHLREFLPPPLVPAHLVWVSELPLSPNGKVDRRALAARPINPEGHQTPYSVPVGFMAVSEVIEQSLGLKRVDPQDNLVDLGITSVEMVRLARDIEQRVGAFIELGELLEVTTVGELQALIDDRGRGSSPPRSFADGTTQPATEHWKAVAELLDEIGGMSDEEVQQQLERARDH